MVVPDDLFGLIPLWVGVYAIGAIAFGVAGWAVTQRFFLPILVGRRDERRFDQPIRRLLGVALVVFGQRRVLMSVSLKWRDLAGIGHFVIFWSFMSMAFSYLLFVFLDSIKPTISADILSGGGLKFFFWWLDIQSVVLLTVLVWAAVRRWGMKPKRLENLRNWDSAIVLLLIGGLMLFHQLTEWTHVAAVLEGREIGRPIAHLVGVQASEISLTTPIAGNIGQGLHNAGLSFGAANTLHGVFFWLHYMIILGFSIYIAYSKHMHTVAAPINTYFRSLKPRGALVPIANIEDAEVWGAKRPQEFSWKELLDGYACAVCGRCTVNCPANLSGKPLSPMHLILNIKENLAETASPLRKASDDREEQERIADQKPLFDENFTEEWVWDCVTCGACEQECPVLVEHIDSIVDLRRHLVMTEARMPPGAEQTLRSLETRGHPWRGSQATRTDWAEGLPVRMLSEAAKDDKPIDVLFWVGCTAALEPRSQSTARAMARVLDRAGVSYAILGPEESCNGDPARRIGHEYLFEIMAKRNVELLDGYQVQTIVTTCPHCFNTLKNEYPDFGGNYQVEHYATYVKRLIDEGRLKLGKPIATTLTYHDSCYLGRINGIYDAPRDLIRAIPGIKLQEIPLRNRERSFCCGAGGGHMWIEETSGRRINHMRTEQALDTNPQMIGVSCPFCLQMFKEGIETAGRKDDVREVDIIELVAESMEE